MHDLWRLHDNTFLGEAAGSMESKSRLNYRAAKRHSALQISNETPFRLLLRCRVSGFVWQNESRKCPGA